MKILEVSWTLNKGEFKKPSVNCDRFVSLIILEIKKKFNEPNWDKYE